MIPHHWHIYTPLDLNYGFYIYYVMPQHTELLAANLELGRQLLFAKTNVITLEEQIEKLKLETSNLKVHVKYDVIITLPLAELNEKLVKQMKQMEEQIEKYKSDAGM